MESLDIHSSTRLLNLVALETPFKTFASATLNNFQGGAFSYIAPGVSLTNTKLAGTARSVTA